MPSVEAHIVVAAEVEEVGTVEGASVVESRSIAEEAAVEEVVFRALKRVERFVPRPVRGLSGQRDSSG